MTDQPKIVYGKTTLTRTSEGGKYRYSPPKWRCDVCGRTGCGDMLIPYEWASACARGHHPCPWCKQQLAVCHDDQPRVHARCRQRPESTSEEWCDAKAEHARVRLVVATGEPS